MPDGVIDDIPWTLHAASACKNGRTLVLVLLLCFDTIGGAQDWHTVMPRKAAMIRSLKSSRCSRPAPTTASS